MIFVYSIKSHHHKAIDLKDHACPLCGEQGKLQAEVNQRYIWWLGPILPAGKFGVVKCDACNKIINKKQWSEKITSIINQEKSIAKTPLRLWRGLIVFLCLCACLVGWAAIEIKKNKQISDLPAALQSLKKDDILSISDSLSTATNNTYAIVKVEKIENNKVYLSTYRDRVKWDEQFSLSPNDFDLAKFSSSTYPVALDAIKERKGIAFFDSSGKKIIPYSGTIFNVIK